jgi:hypothetical protein
MFIRPRPAEVPEVCLACGHETIVRDGAARRCAECGHAWPLGSIVVRVHRPVGPTDRRRRGRRLLPILAVLVLGVVAIIDPILAFVLVVPAMVLAVLAPGLPRRRVLGGYAITPAGIEAWWNGRCHRTIGYGQLTSFRVSPRLGRRPLLLLGHPRGRGFDRAELMTDDATAERIRSMLDRRLPERLPWSPK